MAKKRNLKTVKEILLEFGATFLDGLTGPLAVLHPNCIVEAG